MKKEDLKKEYEAGGVVITKDNIHLYYEFMSDEDILSPTIQAFLSGLFQERINYVTEILNISIEDTNSVAFVESKGRWIVSSTFFGVKDILKPIDEYIAEIKESAAYKEYISTTL